MNSQKSQFNKTNEYKPSEQFIKKGRFCCYSDRFCGPLAVLNIYMIVLGSGICDRVIKWADFKQSEQMVKADGTKILKYVVSLLDEI